MKPTAFSVSREPYRSPGMPANERADERAEQRARDGEAEPETAGVEVKHLALAIRVTPEITTVSKPNNRPARLAVTITPRLVEPLIASPLPTAHIRRE